MAEIPCGRSDQRKAGAIWNGCGTNLRGNGVTVRDSAWTSLAPSLFHFPFCHQCHPMAKSTWEPTDKGTSKIVPELQSRGIRGWRGNVQSLAQ